MAGPSHSRLVFLLLGAATLLSYGQEIRLDWRQIGNRSILHPTGDAATGALQRVWYTSTGIAVSTPENETWQFENEQWKPSTLEVPEERQRASGRTLYKVDGDAFRSEDGGRTWINLTRVDGISILGGPLSDLAISPLNAEDVSVVGADGVWRSLDGGQTWAGLNDGLPNLQITRIVELPSGLQGMKVTTAEKMLEWHPGQKLGWMSSGVNARNNLVVETTRNYLYVGLEDGRIIVTSNNSLRSVQQVSEKPIRRIWIDPRDPATALAISGDHLFRTFNAGQFWDDITGSFAGGSLNGVAADTVSGSIYVGSDTGIYYGSFGFSPIGSVTEWKKVRAAVPDRRATDVRLDAAANQLYVSLDGYGVFAARAPHRRQQPALINSADWTQRHAAPGTLMSIIGQSVSSVRSGDQSVPVLAADEDESQIQVPFEIQGDAFPLRMENSEGQWNLTVPLQETAPAIFIDQDSTPMVLNADSGVLLDAMNPIRSGSRIQILATGLGQVTPTWPTGLPAPLDNPPAVKATVHVFLDGQQLEATRATLAPGYVGFYLVEVEIPHLVNTGTAELYLEADGQQGNRVRVYIEP